MTACEAAPVRAPMNASLTVFPAFAPLLEPPLGLLLLHAAATTKSTATAANTRSELFRDKTPPPFTVRPLTWGRSYHKPKPRESSPLASVPGQTRHSLIFVRVTRASGLGHTSSRSRLPSWAWRLWSS